MRSISGVGGIQERAAKETGSGKAWLDYKAVLLFRTRRQQGNLRETYALHRAFLSKAVSVIQMASRVPLFPLFSYAFSTPCIDIFSICDLSFKCLV